MRSEKKKFVKLLNHSKETSRINLQKINGKFSTKTLIFGSFLISLLLTLSVFGQDTKNGADQTLRGSGRVNASTLGMEFSLPLGNYSGKGINVPISLSYSSKLWRMEHNGNNPIPGSSWSDCYPFYYAKYAEDSASGWTSSLAVPYIEYTGLSNSYNYDGTPVSYDDVTCPTYTGGNNSYPYHYVKRLTIHLPSGETHEFRPDDTVTEYASNNSDPNRPAVAANWDTVYYAIDGSNLKYIQNSSTNTYRLLMPDGSFYDFDPSTQHGAKRKATKFTDRNGNFTTYYGPGSTDSNGVTHANGYWKDTLGRNLSIPVAPTAPTTPTTAQNPQVYSMPGLNGTSPITYKLQWKQLKGSSAAESGLTNFSNNLRYMGDTYGCTNGAGYPTLCQYPSNSGQILFSGGGSSSDPRITVQQLFNPIVLTEIELPTGQKYKFTYDIYGRIEQIHYPTGGEEHFTYGVVATLSMPAHGDITGQTNFGVVNRKVLKYAADPNPYIWTYSAAYAAPKGYKVTINNPDGTKNERFLHRGNDPVPLPAVGTFGYDNGLAGMPYEQRAFDDAGKLVSRQLTHWTLTKLPIWVQLENNGSTFSNDGNWHPRVTHEESYIYDASGSGVYGTTKYEYEGNLGLRETPVLQKKTLQYAFVTTSGGGSITPGGTPNPNPTPVSTPTPPTLLRTTETTYVINDTDTYPEWVRDIYKANNMVGLVRTSTIKDGAGTVVSRSEMRYDDGVLSPAIGRGNPTTSRVWDSTKGAWNNANSYIATYAKFDTYGNRTEATDAKGNTTITEYDSTHNAFPVKVTTPIPGNGTNGSNTAFITTVEFDPITGLPLKTKDANGLETRIEYDPVTLRPKKTKTFYGTNQVGGESETIYHDEPNNYWIKNRSQIDANNWAESITYFDGLGRAYKTEQIHSDGNIFVEKEFDSDGRVLRVSNPYRLNETKYWTTNIYDDASRIKEVVLPDGAKIKTDYGVSVSGVVGTTKQITDQAGKKRKGITDGLGRMVRVIEDPSGQALNTDYVFDTLGNLRKTIQDEQSRYFSYDSLGRLLRAKQPEQDVNANLALATADPITNHNQWSAAYSYDDNGNITTTTDARGHSVTATYDNFNRIIKRDYSDINMPDVDFYYDGKYLDINGNLQTATGSVKGKTTGVKSSVSRTNYTSFDNLGRLLTHQQITDGQTYNTGYTYNLSGALMEETYPSNRKVKTTLNSDGEFEKLESKRSTVNDYKLYVDQITRNSSGAIEKMRLGNGTWESAQYNNRQQITQIGLGHSEDNKSLLKIDYYYGTNTENNSSLRQQKINYAGLPNEIVQDYTYDDLNRLQAAEEKVSNLTMWEQTFSYDRFGNRTFDSNNTTTLSQSATTKVANPTIQTSNNRLTEDQDGGGIDYDYDENGNLILDAENQRFVFDAENHIKEFFRGTNQTPTADATYSYDGEGKRVKKKADGVETIFVYNASGMLVAEYSTEMPQEPKASYLTADHLGSPRIITDGIGIVVSRHDYLAFGDDVTETLGNVGGRTPAQGYGNEDEIRQGYTGYENDKESGLEYAQARYYNASHGRFTSVDPLTASASIRDPQTFNRYSYVLNSPYKFTDPLGLIPETTVACGERCPNSGGWVDGSAFRGTDSNDLTKLLPKPPPPPPTPQAEQNAEPPDPVVLPKEIVDTINNTFGPGAIASHNGEPVRVEDSGNIVDMLKDQAMIFYLEGKEYGRLEQITENNNGTPPTGSPTPDAEAARIDLALSKAAEKLTNDISKVPIKIIQTERPDAKPFTSSFNLEENLRKAVISMLETSRDAGSAEGKTLAPRPVPRDE